MDIILCLTTCKVKEVIAIFDYMNKIKALEKMRAKAESMSGRCLSEEYIDGETKYRWRCVKGHEWLAKWDRVRQSSWCHKCLGKYSRKRLTIERMQEHAEARGGQCLSSVYVNVDTHYLWRCAKGHEWTAEASNVIHSKNWCSVCACNAPKTLDTLREAARVFGGRVLDDEYRGVLAIYTWECAKGHRWQGNANNVTNHKHWCRRCCLGHQSKPETELYEWVLSIFPDALHSTRKLLPNRRLELDIYIPSIKKAIEYDGDYWHSSEAVQARDRQKESQCSGVGIELLRISDAAYRKDKTGLKVKILEFLHGKKQIETSFSALVMEV